MAGDRLQQHIGGAAEVNKLNVEVVFTEYLLLLGDGDLREAYRAFVDRQLDLVGLWQAQRRMGIAMRPCPPYHEPTAAERPRPAPGRR